jgi:phage terminase small subunit
MARGPRPMNNQNIPLQAQVPDAPDWLPAGARREWDRVTGELAPLNVLCNLDVSSLAQYSVLYDQLRSDPAEFTAASHTQLRLLAAELGLSPASRHRLMVLKPLVDKENPFADLTR